MQSTAHPLRFARTARSSWTLAPSANCVGTAEEIKSELQKAAPNAVVSVTEKDGSFEAVIRNVTEALAVNTDNLFHKTYAITAGKPAKTAAFPLLRHAPRLATR